MCYLAMYALPTDGLPLPLPPPAVAVAVVVVVVAAAVASSPAPFSNCGVASDPKASLTLRRASSTEASAFSIDWGNSNLNTLFSVRKCGDLLGDLWMTMLPLRRRWSPPPPRREVVRTQHLSFRAFLKSLISTLFFSTECFGERMRACGWVGTREEFSEQAACRAGGIACSIGGRRERRIDGAAAITEKAKKATFK